MSTCLAISALGKTSQTTSKGMLETLDVASSIWSRVFLMKQTKSCNIDL